MVELRKMDVAHRVKKISRFSDKIEIGGNLKEPKKERISKWNVFCVCVNYFRN